MTKEIELNVVKDYQSKKYFIKDICKKYQISNYAFNNILKKYNIKKYDYHELLPQNQRKFPLNEDFFLKQSSNMAYVLGILASDGTVRKNTNEIKLTLSAVDKNFLESLYNLIGGRPIKEYTDSKGYSNVTWRFSSKIIKNELAKYNIVPNKTHTFKFPKLLEERYWIDFIRGYFDGDGCISTAGKSSIRFQICSKTREILETIIDYFEDKYKINKPSIYKRKDGLYYFQYSSVATRNIYKFLYTDNCLYLPRKKEKYEKLI